MGIFTIDEVKSFDSGFVSNFFFPRLGEQMYNVDNQDSSEIRINHESDGLHNTLSYKKKNWKNGRCILIAEGS